MYISLLFICINYFHKWVSTGRKYENLTNRCSVRLQTKQFDLSMYTWHRDTFLPCFSGFLNVCLFMFVCLFLLHNNWPQADGERKLSRTEVNQTKCVGYISYDECIRVERSINHVHIHGKQLPKRILFYNPAYFQRSRNIRNTIFFTNCETSNCEITFDKKMATGSDAVIIDFRYILLSF